MSCVRDSLLWYLVSVIEAAFVHQPLPLHVKVFRMRFRFTTSVFAFLIYFALHVSLILRSSLRLTRLTCKYMCSDLI
jgi:hypothetical protein